MNKKILIGLGAGVAALASVAMFAAYEAHIINVTAHIENALSVEPRELAFGTVFPQEYVEENFTVSLSDSFLESERDDFIRYEIIQKPKCECLDWPDKAECPEGQYAPVNYATHLCPENYEGMEDLCEFLSKLPDDEEPWDEGVPSYFIEDTVNSCYPRGDGDPRPHIANGVLRGGETLSDLLDGWTVDLKVPPVEGYVGQDWPATCADWTVPVDGEDYGCDLWVEVTCIGNAVDCGLALPVPPDPKELACIASGGTVTTGLCCLSAGDFPNVCSVGACGCGPGSTHEVKVCDCGPERCFNGETCVDFVEP